MLMRRRHQGFQSGRHSGFARILFLTLALACSGEKATGTVAIDPIKVTPDTTAKTPVDTTKATASVVTGTYTLRTMNGYVVPVVTYDFEGYRETVVSGAITLNPDSTFIYVAVYESITPAYGDMNTEIWTGRWALSDSTLTLNGDGGGGSDALLTAAGLSMQTSFGYISYGTYVYRK